MITFPSWYVGGWPNREDVVQAFLQPFLDLLLVYDSTGAQVLNAGGSPRHPTACSWLTGDYSADLPLVPVYSGGGNPGVSEILDPRTVLLGAIGESRDDSWAILEYCVDLLVALPRGTAVKMPGGSHVQVTSVVRTIAPELRMDINPDDRLVIATLDIDCRWPRTAPDYGPIVAELASA